jgi:uncharacterized protein YecE (DUF72 family)
MPPPSRSEKAAASPAVITIGCAGFPVPATRYFKELLFVEVQETHVASLGTGTIRRWRREAPTGFTFSMLAPREVGHEGFRAGKGVESALKMLQEAAKELGSTTVVFVAPTDFANSRANKAVTKEFLHGVNKRFQHVVWEPPSSWDIDDASALVEDTGAVCARDPLTHGLSRAPRAYYRLPGPAGHKSRYEDPAIERLGDLARSARHADATYVFTNVDMFADARRLKKLVGVAPANR